MNPMFSKYLSFRGVASPPQVTTGTFVLKNSFSQLVCSYVLLKRSLQLFQTLLTTRKRVHLSVIGSYPHFEWLFNMQVVVSLDATLDKSRRKIEFGNKPFLWTKVLRCLGPGMCNLSSHESFGCKTCGTIFKIWIRKTITHTSAFLLPTILITDPIYYANTTHPLPLTQTDNPFTDAKTELTLQVILPIAEAKAPFLPQSFMFHNFFPCGKDAQSCIRTDARN